jgi:hypothetical protein
MKSIPEGIVKRARKVTPASSARYVASGNHDYYGGEVGIKAEIEYSVRPPPPPPQQHPGTRGEVRFYRQLGFPSTAASAAAATRLAATRHPLRHFL